MGSTVQTPAHMRGASPNRPSTKPAGRTPSQGSAGLDAGPQGASTWHPDPAQTHCLWPVCATVPQAAVMASRGELFLEKPWGRICKLGVTALRCAAARPGKVKPGHVYPGEASLYRRIPCPSSLKPLHLTSLLQLPGAWPSSALQNPLSPARLHAQLPSQPGLPSRLAESQASWPQSPLR